MAFREPTKATCDSECDQLAAGCHLQWCFFKCHLQFFFFFKCPSPQTAVKVGNLFKIIIMLFRKVTIKQASMFSLATKYTANLNLNGKLIDTHVSIQHEK